MIALTAAGTAAILGWILKYSSYGIDFTDESFYFVWISDPFIYDYSVTQFGFVYHPLYFILNGDIVALRQANIVITFGLAWGLTYTLLASLAPNASESRFNRHIAATGLASGALAFFSSWLPTPSYNSLALQALLITSIGLLMADKTTAYKSLAGWIIIGIGGWLAFMAKPSTALALAVAVFIYILISKKFSPRPLLLAAGSALALLLFSALLIDGSVLGFVQRLQVGVEFSNYLGGGHTFGEILRIDNFQLPSRSKFALFLVSATTFLAILGILVEKPTGAIASMCVSIGFFSITAVWVLGEIHEIPNFGQFQGLLIFGIAFAAGLTSLIFAQPEILRRVDATQWGLALIFLAMPHIYAFGTNGNYWENGGAAAIFWLLAGVTLLGPAVQERVSWTFALPLALATQAVTATLIQTGLEAPPRQPQPLRLNESNLTFGREPSALMLSAGYASYMADVIAVAHNSGFNAGTPVIDLSGQSPGILYAIGAENIGQAWTIGGYPGSLKLAEAALGRVPCDEIAAAWVLYEPDGPRSIPKEVMSSFGAAFPEDYHRVGSWRTAENAGGYAARRSQELYQPATPNETSKACHALRGTE